MKKGITVAVYSGVSKSTTFIERLIKGLVKKNVNVLVFGVANGKCFQSKSIKYHCYGSKLNKLIRLCKYTLLLSLFKPKDKIRLDEIIKSNTIEPKRVLRLKYYPVLYYKPDIFHLQWAKSIKDWMWVQEFGMKLVVSLRGTHITISPKANPFYKDLYLELFPKVTAFHAVSESISKEAEKYNADPDKINVVKSGLLLESFQFQSKKQIYKPLKIISVGRSHFSKGYSFALDAMAILKEKKTAFHYTIIGVEEDEKLIHQRSQLQLKKEVTLKESVSFSKVKEELKDADVLLLSSIEEGIANVVLEAMALGILVVSSNCGGMNEVITNEENGFLVPPRDINAMANCIMEVKNLSESDYNTIIKKARLKIEQNHSHEKMVSGMLNLYKTVLNN
ncbi:glycosyltransferase family 4 protein [Winogradskyella immobilis]|uniref:Glycosyltransferase family 4 protein n=1 Tax=Winogradskyella immobilis TaxID=2816852 RepID=A0ABS8ENV9_9FLAO|nr:glycosyltransferase family 4 protein [Winogradskyella immobilis]MCC1484891.1 glycosyltransferase family 4 protein [Winogradskyella immobilis]MCG0016983.1 glycosyltransferase family 4 protein [Winogradskyella immobilis]